MQQQQVPLLSRVVLLHAAVLGSVLAMLQISSNLRLLRTQNITIPVSAQVQHTAPQKTIPKRLQLPRININVAVAPGRYDATSRTWQISDDKAQYITGTTPNLTMIYGHNTSVVFELTNSLQVGDELILTNSNGSVQRYRYVSDHLTVASDTSDLTASYETPTVALLTCNGFWSQDRRFMFFKPVEEPRS